MSRAHRRQESKRAYHRATRMVKILGIHPTPQNIHRLATDRTPCSCNMCGNQRRHFGDLTRQELLSKEEN